MTKVKDYNFSLIQGSYVPLQGVKTVFQMGAQLNTDGYSSDVALPFPFTIGGDAYTTIRIYNNGFISFGKGLNNGQTMDANVKSPISNTVKAWANDYIVSAFGTNVVAANVGSPEISYGVNTGGDFVIQFQDVAVSGFTQTRATAQIILKVNGTTIEIVYGPNNTGQFNVVSPQVGLRGKTTVDPQSQAYRVTDWQTRSVPKGSNANIFEANQNYPNNSNGKNASSQVSWSNAPTVLPQSGLTLQWTI